MKQSVHTVLIVSFLLFSSALLVYDFCFIVDLGLNIKSHFSVFCFERLQIIYSPLLRKQYVRYIILILSFFIFYSATGILLTQKQKRISNKPLSIINYCLSGTSLVVGFYLISGLSRLLSICIDADDILDDRMIEELAATMAENNCFHECFFESVVIYSQVFMLIIIFEVIMTIRWLKTYKQLYTR